MTDGINIFECFECAWQRAYGNNKNPEQLLPWLKCAKCQKTTQHRWVTWALRDGRHVTPLRFQQ